MLKDEKLIDMARSMLRGSRPMLNGISGEVVKVLAGYNQNYSYNLKPESINFGAAQNSSSLCDGTFLHTEQQLAEYGSGNICQWVSVFNHEVFNIPEFSPNSSSSS
jgi:hypothetical protein